MIVEGRTNKLSFAESTSIPFSVRIGQNSSLADLVRGTDRTGLLFKKRWYLFILASKCEQPNDKFSPV